MSTETGTEKRRLSQSNNESEEDAAKTETEKTIDNSKNSESLDEHDHEKESQTAVGIARTGEENTEITPTNVSSNVTPGDGSRQIIAVSANKNPTAFFQLARKFLMTNEMCDLSALEGAIVSAVDAAHLLERSKLASIVRIHTSYVNVEPKRRRQVSQQKGEISSTIAVESTSLSNISEDKLPSSATESSLSTNNTTGNTKTNEQPQPISSIQSNPVSDSKKNMKVTGAQQGGQQSKNAGSSLSGSGNRELRRARILVTVKRTESYKRWLEENPSQRQAIIAGTATVTAEDIVGDVSPSKNNVTGDLPTTTEQEST